MKLTKFQLKQVIKEELQKATLQEQKKTVRPSYLQRINRWRTARKKTAITKKRLQLLIIDARKDRKKKQDFIDVIEAMMAWELKTGNARKDSNSPNGLWVKPIAKPLAPGKGTIDRPGVQSRTQSRTATTKKGGVTRRTTHKTTKGTVSLYDLPKEQQTGHYNTQVALLSNLKRQRNMNRAIIGMILRHSLAQGWIPSGKQPQQFIKWLKINHKFNAQRLKRLIKTNALFYNQL